MGAVGGVGGMSMLDTGYACGVLVVAAGCLLLGITIGRARAPRRQQPEGQQTLVAVARLALRHGATPAELQQHLGPATTAAVCWPADTVVIPRVDRGSDRPSPRPRSQSRIRDEPPRYVHGRQAVPIPGEEQELKATRMINGHELRDYLDGAP